MNPSVAYLDIETTFQGHISIVGLYRPSVGIVQLIDEDVTPVNLLDSLQGIEIIKTYNGSRFDLPVIQHYLGLNLKVLFIHHDVMYRCWKYGLKGGLKAVERQLGIYRQTEGMDGIQAMYLWAQWKQSGDKEALRQLLLYNREDVELLAQVDEHLFRWENQSHAQDTKI